MLTGSLPWDALYYYIVTPDVSGTLKPKKLVDTHYLGARKVPAARSGFSNVVLHDLTYTFVGIT